MILTDPRPLGQLLFSRHIYYEISLALFIYYEKPGTKSTSNTTEDYLALFMFYVIIYVIYLFMLVIIYFLRIIYVGALAGGESAECFYWSLQSL